MSFCVNARSSLSAFTQSSHDISLSWQYALLLPLCVLLISSPETSIGTPCDNMSVLRNFFFCFLRGKIFSVLSLGPPPPQSHGRFCLSPSLLFSPSATLFFSLYDKRSCGVN